MEETIRSYTVSTYGDAVNRLIRGKIPNIWVRGTLMQVRPSGRAVYMKLAEFEGDSPNPKATLDLIAWQGKFESLSRKAAEAPVPFELRADVQVCVLLEADFYVPHGKFQPHVLDIDENYTMGEMERVRREILARLAAEGLLDAQRSLSLPAAPLRVGLVTAAGSAAAHDFAKVIAGSGFPVEVLLENARMQGAETAPTVAAAIAALEARDVDCVCVVRGGGSRSDLAWFDDERVCRAIAQCSVPVLTGIGHEIDNSLADRVAWMRCITPTETAGTIVARLQEALDAVSRTGRSLERVCRAAVGRARADMAALSRDILHLSRGAFRDRAAALGNLARLVRPRANRAFERCADRLRVDAHGLAMGSRKILDRERTLADARESVVRAADPRRVLERGFALVRDAAGRALRFGALAEGAKVELRFAEGEADAVVGALRPAPSAGEEERQEANHGR